MRGKRKERANKYKYKKKFTRPIKAKLDKSGGNDFRFVKPSKLYLTVTGIRLESKGVSNMPKLTKITD